MVKTIASISDGRVVPWYSDEPVPAGFVEVPAALLSKFAAGKIAVALGRRTVGVFDRLALVFFAKPRVVLVFQHRGQIALGLLNRFALANLHKQRC